MITTGAHWGLDGAEAVDGGPPRGFKITSMALLSLDQVVDLHVIGRIDLAEDHPSRGVPPHVLTRSDHFGIRPLSAMARAMTVKGG